jgi:hypothetical protein
MLAPHDMRGTDDVSYLNIEFELILEKTISLHYIFLDNFYFRD